MVTSYSNNTLVALRSTKVKQSRFFYLYLLLDKTATNMPKEIINGSIWKTLIDRESFLNIFSLSMDFTSLGKMAAVLKTAINSVYYTN